MANRKVEAECLNWEINAKRRLAVPTITAAPKAKPAVSTTFSVSGLSAILKDVSLYAPKLWGVFPKSRRFQEH